MGNLAGDVGADLSGLGGSGIGGELSDESLGAYNAGANSEGIFSNSVASSEGLGSSGFADAAQAIDNEAFTSTGQLATNSEAVNAYNISTAGLTDAERQAVIEYAQRSNAWLADNGPVTVQSTAGALRSQANEAARLERLSAARAGTPYLGQVGHVPDTALTGMPIPPAGWLDMPGISNNVIGGGLSSRIGQTVNIITVDGKVP